MPRYHFGWKEKLADSLPVIGRIVFQTDQTTPTQRKFFSAWAITERDRHPSVKSIEHDSLNILVNSAGATWTGSFAEFPEKGWDRVLNTNLEAAFFLSQKLLPQLKAAASKENLSQIINISSNAARKTSLLGDYSYRASKIAMNHMTRLLARDLGPDHINIKVAGYPLFIIEDVQLARRAG